jgi:hypothetical protein
MDFKRLGLIGLGVFVMLFSSLVRYSFGFGVNFCVLSVVSVVGPLLGLILGFWEIACVLVLYSVASTFLKGTLFLPFLTTFGLPTLVASYVLGQGYNRFQSSIIRESVRAALFVGLPLVGMILFFLHPVGKDALFYTAYWFIPMIVYGYQKAKSGSSLVATALASTFLAHAIGSVIYLYTFSFTAHQWLSLIPVVAAERLMIAGGIVLATTAVNLISVRSRSKVKA